MCVCVARSFISANMCAVDRTTEKTFMRHEISQAGPDGWGAGILGFLNNYEVWYVRDMLKIEIRKSNTTNGICDR